MRGTQHLELRMMAKIDPKLFKKYDIRGKAEGDDAPLTTGAARLIGKAFGTYLDRVAGVQTAIVGRDNRRTSPALAGAMIEGIQASGCAVIDIRLTSTPILYWHAVHEGNVGGVMVTGSHLTPDQNGFKLCVGARNVYGDHIEALRLLIEDEDFNSGYEMVRVKDSALVDYIVDVVPRLRMARGLHVVVDGGNGTGGAFGPRLLKAWGHRVTELFCELDGSYPNHQPDPQVMDNLRALADAVREVGADVGIAFDGDADRMGVVDEQGNMIGADRVLTLLAGDMLRRHPGAKVVADVLSSQVLFDEIAKAGGMPIMWASGHSLVKAKMAEVGALIGGEMSGHIFLAEDYYGFDDAYVAAGRLLQLISAAQMPLSLLNAKIPMLHSTPEYRPHCPDDLKEAVVAAVKAALEGQGEVTSIDGIRVRFERGWGLLRASNTEPVLSMRFEGETETDAIRYRDLFFAELRKFPQVELKA